jgi:hypothetical protein
VHRTAGQRLTEGNYGRVDNCCYARSPGGMRPRGQRARCAAMTRETVAAKACRYLAEGRIIVVAVDGDLVRAWCRGDGEVYQLGHEPGRGWHCSCPAMRDTCCHLTALRRVTVRPQLAVAAPAGCRATTPKRTVG